MSKSELSNHTRISKYAKYYPEVKRRSTFEEQIYEVLYMHKTKYKNYEAKLKPYFDFIEPVMLSAGVLGSQRGLQFAGSPILEKNARLYNCSASYCNRVSVFHECLWLLLCGVGTGLSVQKHHINKLPSLIKVNKNINTYFSIPDTIEGWAEALGVLMSSYFENNVPYPEYRGTTVNFDYSLIRPKGSAIRGITGKAPGPEPLRIALENIRVLLDNYIGENERKKITPIVAYDTLMYATEAVLSGGVRRSATLFLFSKDDEEMMKAKTGNWWEKNPQRAMSNNSVVLMNDETTREDFAKIMKCVKDAGEPGFAFLKNKDDLFNPCFEVLLRAIDDLTGLSGWQMCNLTEINGGQCDNEEKFYTLCKVSAILGTLQAGYTDFPFLGEISERIIRRDALLGCSITGFADNSKILLDPEIQRKGAEIIKQVNEEVANIININPAARTTCVKPAGHTSALLGTASGIHSHYSKRYIRHVRENKMSATLQHFKKFNPFAVEHASDTDDVISFIIENEDHVLTKDTSTALEFLERVKLTQNNWVRQGTRGNPELGTNNVSNTVYVRDNEWEEVEEYLYNNRQYFTGVSMLKDSGDKEYFLAPFTAVYTKEESMQKYNITSDDYSELRDFVLFNIELDPEFNSLFDFCYMLLNDGYNGINNDNIKLFFEFMNKYRLNITNMVYLLKDIANWHKFTTIKDSYKHVDWTTMQEFSDNTKHNEMYTCAGGACELK